MGQQGKLILKKNKIKLSLIVFILLLLKQQCHSQKCIDTLDIKGYYIVKRMKSEHQYSKQKIKQKNIKKKYMNIDTYQDEFFIPIDSINTSFSLSDRLNNFPHFERQIFMSCQRIYLNNLLSKECLYDFNVDSKSCKFPELKPKFYYVTDDPLSNSFFEIYFFDATWAKIKVQKGSFQAHLVNNRQVRQIDFTKSDYFNLFYFLKNTTPILEKPVNEKNIKRWIPK